MILYAKHAVLGKGRGIVAAVTKEDGSIQHRDLHLLQRAKNAIVVSNVFQNGSPFRG
jgi:hypothetical protein